MISAAKSLSWLKSWTRIRRHTEGLSLIASVAVGATLGQTDHHRDPLAYVLVIVPSLLGVFSLESVKRYIDKKVQRIIKGQLSQLHELLDPLLSHDMKLSIYSLAGRRALRLVTVYDGHKWKVLDDPKYIFPAGVTEDLIKHLRLPFPISRHDQTNRFEAAFPLTSDGKIAGVVEVLSSRPFHEPWIAEVERKLDSAGPLMSLISSLTDSRM